MAKNLFNTVKLNRPKRSVFDLSHDVKLSLRMGQLIPTMCTELVPGDKFTMSCESMIRFAPMLAPIMHRVDCSMHYFFVPNRILWPNWEKYITNTPVGGGDNNLPAFPTLPYSTSSYSQLYDYLGLPPIEDDSSNSYNINALPFAAYQKIYNDLYRDQNLIEDLEIELLDGFNDQQFAKLTAIRNRAWEHDYFTSALPWAQKGNAVDIPLGTVGLVDDLSESENPAFIGKNGESFGGNISQIDLPEKKISGSASIPLGEAGVYDPKDTLQVEATTINDLRRAFRLQEWLEKAARGGSRYIENILVHFGVKSSDKRLQRPEYITGIKAPVVISEVLNTTGTEDAPQGNMAGHGVAVTSGKYGSYFAEEHGYIMCIMSVMPKTAYQDGIPKHFLKTTDPFQFYWPSFAHLGEQPIVNSELFVKATDPDGVFGYVPRYAEYKFENNRVAGDFRTSLDFWHMGRKFATEPMLNADFVTAQPTDRIFAVADQPTNQNLWCHVFHKVKAVRPMPKFGTPTF